MKTQLRRFIKRAYVKWARGSRQNSNYPRPKRLNSEETLALDIWLKICHTPSSLLLYDPEKYECYAILQDEEHPVYLFLEANRMKIINSTVGYTVQLDSKCEQWCSSIFLREVGKRRKALKRNALGRVVHSLEGLYDVIKTSHQ